MGALPKRKITKARRGERRSHLHLPRRALVECPHCHEWRLPHRACPACGYYKDLEVIKLKVKKGRGRPRR